ncbi:DeoR/GlpR family DNA-binding transcription regulator [Thalassovita taeanensis]|uniref:Transcriptional regulator, DeoR family n=1 Tax=Thalassovita taeanensis TaxID=657014 RepID=A0A1H9J713_9RHOB|nr:DeoR/GlpR family DNA-binding transcription regulator [Thalassovita taeanensis]SEQ82576.1 transcriptional regulator, DeoR family [Thalassovita taeanensis]
MIELNPRQREIVERLHSAGHQTIQELSLHFNVATQTLRRDINALCDAGLARRVHGGVAPPSNPVNLNFHARRILNEGIKRAIGRKTAGMIPNGASVLLGIGSTVHYVAEALLNHTDLMIVTNNLDVASILCAASTAEVHVIGGVLRGEDRDMVGERAMRDLASVVADFGIIGAGALDPTHGIMDFKRSDADMNCAILQNSRRTILVSDSSKWDKHAHFRVSGFEAVDVFVSDDHAMSRHLNATAPIELARCDPL